MTQHLSAALRPERARACVICPAVNPDRITISDNWQAELINSTVRVARYCNAVATDHAETVKSHTQSPLIINCIFYVMAAVPWRVRIYIL